METWFISIIIPIFEEGENLRANLLTIVQVLKKNQISFEFILIDDGSSDDTWEVIRSLPSSIPVYAVRLTRNFGKEAAIFAGLRAARGDACIIMDADLQHPPEVIPQMVYLWRNKGFEIIDGLKITRGKESLGRKFCSHFFYRILKGLSGIDLNGASDFKLLDRKVINALRNIKERNVFFRGLSAWVGFTRTTIPFKVAERTSGKSKWSNWKLIKLALTAVTSFSSLPLQIINLMGTAFFIGSVFLGIYALYAKIQGVAVSGFTTVILLELSIGSLVLISLGIIGTYIARIFEEIKFRPRYLISEVMNRRDCMKVIKHESGYDSYHELFAGMATHNNQGR